MAFESLPTLAQLRQQPVAVPKAKSRLQDRVEVKKGREQQERVFKATIWARDKSRCRKCGCKVRKTMERAPNRGEVHHVYGRVGCLRYEDRSALLLCLTHHEQVTGKVNQRMFIYHDVKTGRTFKDANGDERMDARYPVYFSKSLTGTRQ